MKSVNKIILLLSIVFLLNSCSEDDAKIINVFGAAFNDTSLNLNEAVSYNIPIVFNNPASQNGTITIKYTLENTNYDVDFNTVPTQNTDNKIIVNFSENDIETSFTFTKLQDALQGTDKLVTFEIIEIAHADSQISGNTTTQISYLGVASLGTSIMPTVGGPNQNNSVYIDLSGESETVKQRDIWDLGFYSGDDFKVLLNGSIGMGAGALTTSDINAVTDVDSEVQNIQNLALISTNDGSNVPYFDSSDGNINGVVISDISEIDSDNKVYIVNLGFELSTITPPVGSVAISGNLKGWKKIRILRNGDDYVLQYADLNDTTHQEVSITKNQAFNFTFFDFETNAEVNVEPEKQNWDLHFSPYNKEFLFGGGTAGFIFFSDMVLTNTKNNVEVYLVNGVYDDFEAEDINEALFSRDHTTIGSDWRSVFSVPPSAIPNRFFVLKDTDDNIYKIEFTAFLGIEDNLGVRGFPEFRYKLVE